MMTKDELARESWRKDAVRYLKQYVNSDKNPRDNAILSCLNDSQDYMNGLELDESHHLINVAKYLLGLSTEGVFELIYSEA
jgi:hypothetical protein